MSGPSQGSTEEILANSLSNGALAMRISMLAVNRRAFSKVQADAYLMEAVARLAWSDNYAKHEVTS